MYSMYMYKICRDYYSPRTEIVTFPISIDVPAESLLHNALTPFSVSEAMAEAVDVNMSVLGITVLTSMMLKPPHIRLSGAGSWDIRQVSAAISHLVRTLPMFAWEHVAAIVCPGQASTIPLSVAKSIGSKAPKEKNKQYNVYYIIYTVGMIAINIPIYLV